MVDWNAIKAQTVIKSRTKTGMVDDIRLACKVLMADGKEYPVNAIASYVSAGLTAEARAKDPDAPVVKVNWSTAKTALEGMPGVKEVKHNVFQIKKVTAPK